MGVPMPPVVVLIVCKSMIVGPGLPETGWEQRAWVIEDGKMQCRREVIQMTSAEDTTFSKMDCMRAGIMAIPQWDQAHRSGSYRGWKVACPVPVVDTGPDNIPGTADDTIIDWTLPDCGSRETVVCEKDIAI